MVLSEYVTTVTEVQDVPGRYVAPEIIQLFEVLQVSCWNCLVLYKSPYGCRCGGYLEGAEVDIPIYIVFENQYRLQVAIEKPSQSVEMAEPCECAASCNPTISVCF